MGARPKRNGSKNMTTIPPHFAPMEDRDSAVTSDRNCHSIKSSIRLVLCNVRIKSVGVRY